MLTVVIKLVYLKLFASLQATKLYSCTAPLLLKTCCGRCSWLIDKLVEEELKRSHGTSLQGMFELPMKAD